MTTQTARIDDDTTTHQFETRFGTFQAEWKDIITFPDGIPGFEHCRHFALLSSPELAPVYCLHNVEGPATSFLAVDPRIVLPTFRSVLSDADRARLGVAEDADPLWLALLTVEADGSAWVNLRAPIVVNSERMIGYQMVPKNAVYPMRHPLTIKS
jgi:flagellar assembly factor FliW